MASSQQEVVTTCDVCRQSSGGYRENAIVHEEVLPGKDTDAKPSIKIQIGKLAAISIIMVLAIAFPFVMLKLSIGLAIIATVALIIYGLYKLFSLWTWEAISNVLVSVFIIGGPGGMVVFLAYQLGTWFMHMIGH